jgi:hypothetical protein
MNAVSSCVTVQAQVVQGTCLGLTMVTGVTVSPGMEMETSGGRLLEINEARVADKPRDHPDHD